MKTIRDRDAEAIGARIVKMNEAAERLSATPRTIANLIQEGRLKKVVLPGRKRALGVTAESLERLIDSCTVDGVDPESGAK